MYTFYLYPVYNMIRNNTSYKRNACITPQGAHPLGLLNGVQWELAPHGKPARLLKEGGCVDPSEDTMHLKDPLVLFGFEGTALSLTLFLLSARIYMLCHWFSMCH